LLAVIHKFILHRLTPDKIRAKLFPDYFSGAIMSQKLSRREALRALAAAAGAAVLATVPTKWETPLVEIGAIPAHAQSSAPLVITDFQVRTRDCYYDAVLNYNDPHNLVGLNSTVKGNVCINSSYALTFAQFNRPRRTGVTNNTINFIIDVGCCTNGSQVTAQINASNILSNIFTTFAT
jgi:hypothetical protein